jgi:hypothetical protein
MDLVAMTWVVRRLRDGKFFSNKGLAEHGGVRSDWRRCYTMNPFRALRCDSEEEARAYAFNQARQEPDDGADAEEVRELTELLMTEWKRYSPYLKQARRKNHGNSETP